MSNDVEAKGSVDATTDAQESSDTVTLPEIPKANFDEFSSMFGSTVEDRVKKRASNILKLTEENQKLAAELKAISDRLEAAERRRRELAQREQKVMGDRAQ
ncbi:hypothetical protein AX14_006214 [Amanita brunnescens Koide BX004]|nr:hypothetical protein AX14_006214 [Amanita brunnescens Koide BX004]